MDLATFRASVRAADHEEKRWWVPVVLGYMCLLLALYAASRLLHWSDLADRFALGGMMLSTVVLAFTMYRDHESRSRHFGLRCPNCGASFFTQFNNPEDTGE